MKIWEKKKCISSVFITIITIKYGILKIVYLYKEKLSSKFWRLFKQHSTLLLRVFHCLVILQQVSS